MQIQPELLFTYGTLKDRKRLRAMLKDVTRWRIVGHGTVQGLLYDTGPYPALAMSDDRADRVPGVLVKLESGGAGLARFDEYEDVEEGLYVRRRMPVQIDEATTQDAWVYVYCRSVDGFARISEW